MDMTMKQILAENQERLNARFEARSRQGRVSISVARSPESVIARRKEIDADVVRCRFAADRKRKRAK